MYKEIGSEFWEIELNKEIKSIQETNYAFLLSGRTSLDYIIKDLKVSKDIKSVYMPSYCCHTMIQPFISNGVDVEFYDIDFENNKYTYKIDYNIQCDAILIMQYFGYNNKTVTQIIKRFKELGKIIIEDATHSWFSEIPYNNKSDYAFVSFRKWTGVPCGALAIKQYGNFNVPVSDCTKESYINIRLKAASLKKKYIEKSEGDKKSFLRLFDQAENLLDFDYKDYSIPEYYESLIARLDIELIKTIRHTNANFLISELKNFEELKTVDITSKDTPLFVPIIVKNGKRDELRQHLINNEIYCPIHWIISNEHRIESFYLYKNSLSLVCDQRYDLSDMKKIIDCINGFYRKGV